MENKKIYGNATVTPINIKKFGTGGGSGEDEENPTSYVTYGVSIDLSNSNPESSVIYTDDAVGMVGGSTDWFTKNIFKNIKPCLFKNGAVVGYLNPDNFAQFEDGTAADISSGDSGDVMIEIPKTGYKIAKNGKTLTVQITDDPNKEGFSYKAHTRKNKGDRENLYIGAFLGSNVSGKLRSLADKSPLHTKSLGDFRTLAQNNNDELNNGMGYDLLSFYPLTLIQCLYLIMYKNLNSQQVLGIGYISDYTSGASPIKTGTTINKGMNYRSKNGLEHMKFLGVEDFWGNLYHWIDGIVSDEAFHAFTSTDNFNDKHNGYSDLGALCTKVVGGYMKVPQGNNDAGFIISESGGSSSTFFTDYSHFYNGAFAVFGGSYSDGLNAGIFNLIVSMNNAPYGYIGGRLMYL